MNKNELDSLINQGEGQNLEFKESYSSSLAKEICAFANASGGKILIGITDSGELKGISITNRLKSQITDIARKHESPVKISLEEVDNVLAVNVPEGSDKPYSTSGKFYLRTGPNSQQLSRDEIREFFQREGKIVFVEKFNKVFNLKADISNKAYKTFLQLSNITNKISRAQLLENLNLIGENNLKNAGVLLFCKDVEKFINYATIRCITFQGTENLKILDRKEFSSDLYSNYLNALKYLKEKLNTEYIIRTAGPREEKLELPEEALKEALLNALGHRDYFATAEIAVEIYSDRVEIINPGGLVKGFKKQDLGKKSNPRNILLFGLLQRMDLVEKAGTGIKRIRDEMKNYKLPNPKIDVNGDWFNIIFKRPQDSYEDRIFGKKLKEKKWSERLGEKLGERLGENEGKILDLIYKNKFITTKELSDKIGISTTAIDNNIAKLKQKGILKRIGPAKGGHWEIVDR